MRWEVVQIGARCGFGCQIPKGERVLIGRRGFKLCAACARKQYNLTPPRGIRQQEEQRSRDAANARDGKLRQLPSGESK